MAQPSVRPLAAPDPEGCRSVEVRSWQRGEGTLSERYVDQVAEEYPVALVYNGISHVVMMASPCNLEDFALGFSLSEGILASPAELYSVELEPHDEGYEVQLTIAAGRMAALKERRRNLAGRTGCGLCGTESLQQAIRPISPVSAQPLPSDQAVQRALAQLADWQPLQALTGACHGAAWCDLAGEIRLVREDVGRHNALDKLVGALYGQGIDPLQGFALVSSRASYEMVQKSAAVGIATLVAVSAPTALAIRQAEQAGVNLIGFARQGRHMIYNQALGSNA
ncbi:formate dehydrogenase accessory sulfurtransferase FdhD [Marinobacterium arenosum]|uniref:formate dehydrogenase accessory sulfurtransferase FdhD n=1 Tax=Marinobacterium arenosum TaxID=2862496 RepID=UPI001C98B8A4|nr:formate dehydrogenase accessory sulfurtransferase FdhD [Marinobacterium arenosum]MBY4675433.1 formate dehydrogenase accessory sulfurtransferase FdhD [Marinobacterium arenosum]